MLFYILFYFVSFLLNCLKCLIQILDDIVDVLGTDGKTDGVWFDSLIQQFFLGALAVCSGCRMDHQRFYISNVSQQGEQLQIVDEIFCFLCIAFDFEGEDGTAAVREVFCVQCLLLRIIGYRRMMYFFYLWLALQIFYNLQRVLYMTLYTERQCLKSLQKQEGIERRKRSSGITKKDRTYFCNECSRSNCFCKADAVVARVWLGQGCEFAGSLQSIYRCLRSHHQG